MPALQSQLSLWGVEQFCSVLSELLLCTAGSFSPPCSVVHCWNLSPGSGLASQSHVLRVLAGASLGRSLCFAQLLVRRPTSSSAVHPTKCELLVEGGQRALV